MKYYYLFILIVIISGCISEGRKLSTSELNNDQVSQIDCLIITSQYEEKGVANKVGSLMFNPPYYIRRLCYETTPMVSSNQFVKPVLKYGIPGKEPEYSYDNESPRLGLFTSENRKAVILNRSIWIQIIGKKMRRKKSYKSIKKPLGKSAALFKLT